MLRFAPVTILGHIALAVVTAILVGAIDGLGAGVRAHVSPLNVLHATALAAGLAAMPGALVGLLQGVTARILARLPLWRRLAFTVRRAWERFADGDRDGVLVLHAMGAALVLLLGGFVVALRLVVPAVWELPEAAFGQSLLVAIVVLGLAGVTVALIPVSGAIHAVLRLVERFVRLPWPRPAAVRYLLYVALPVGALVVPFVLAHREELGPAGAAPALVLFLVIEGLVWHALSAGHLLWRRAPVAGLQVGALVVAVLLAQVTLLSWSATDAAALAVSRTWLSNGEAALVRRATDVDRDGFSSLLGGGDCAAFDKTRNPSAVDIPDNGVDEDCDGEDATLRGEAARKELRRYHGDLDEALVKRWNVVWIIIDAVRADHVSALGYKRKTTPYLDALAKESLLFSRARSQSSGTDMSIPSMLSGQDPSAMDWLTDRPFYGLGPGVETLAERLGAKGWRSAILVNAWINKNVRSYGRGYDVAGSVYPEKEWKTWSKRASPLVTTKAIEQIERWDAESQRGNAAPFFLTVYYEDPHHTYERHPGKGYPSFGSKDVDRYDGEIAFADRSVGFLLEHLRHKPAIWKNTIVVVTADHGEEFKEHGGQFHNRTCYEESVGVPLWFRVPGLPGKRVDSPVALLDVVPAILELIGAPAEDPRLAGQSLLVPSLLPKEAPAARPITCAVHSRNKGTNTFIVRSVVSGSDKLISNPVAGTRELYDLKTDAREKHNRIDDAQDEHILERLERLLADALRHPSGS